MSAITNSEVKRISTIALIILLFYVSFIVLKPILISIIIGMVLAYAFLPLYRKTLNLIKEKNVAALVICALIILILLVPPWFLIPKIIQQTFDFSRVSQTFDVGGILEMLFPNSSPDFKREAVSMIYTFTGKVTTTILNALIGFFLNLPTILLHITVIIFVFFFVLRDHEKLRDYISGISPFRKDKEKLLAKKFKDVTSSVVYGYIVVGIIQGIVAGIGFFIFGVPKALLLTVFAIFASILPMIGPWLVWVPVAIYLFATGDTGAAIGFTIYAVLLVSSIDNLLRPYIVSKKSGVSTVIALVGMIGGLLVFGIAGVLLGPLILAYLIVFLSAYKDKTLSEMFSTEDS